MLVLFVLIYLSCFFSILDVPFLVATRSGVWNHVSGFSHVKKMNVLKTFFLHLQKTCSLSSSNLDFEGTDLSSCWQPFYMMRAQPVCFTMHSQSVSLCTTGAMGKTVDLIKKPFDILHPSEDPYQKGPSTVLKTCCKKLPRGRECGEIRAEQRRWGQLVNCKQLNTAESGSLRGGSMYDSVRWVLSLETKGFDCDFGFVATEKTLEKFGQIISRSWNLLGSPRAFQLLLLFMTLGLKLKTHRVLSVP